MEDRCVISRVMGKDYSTLSLLSGQPQGAKPMLVYLEQRDAIDDTWDASGVLSLPEIPSDNQIFSLHYLW